MATTVLTVQGNSENQMVLSISVSNDTITVSAGNATFGGVPRNLTEDETFTSTSRSVTTSVQAYLAVDHSDSDTVRVFVDEVPMDGISEGIAFEEYPDFTFLAHLYNISIPPLTTNLQDLDLVTWELVP